MGSCIGGMTLNQSKYVGSFAVRFYEIFDQLSQLKNWHIISHIYNVQADFKY